MAWNTATALDALRSPDLLDLGMAANQLRLNLHPELVVTYELGGRSSSLEKSVSETMFHGGVSVDLERIRDAEHHSLDVLKTSLLIQRDRFPGVTFQHLPISRLKFMAGNVLAFAEILPGLYTAGLRSISMEFEPASSSPPYEELRGLCHAAADCGLCIAVAIIIGNSESFERRIDTLKLLRNLQQDSDSIQVVLVRVHHTAAADARREEEATAVDYLKTLAVTRLLLDNVEHIQTEWSVMGPKILELALRFGADDAGAVPWSQSGNPEPSHHGGESELRRIIRDAGFRPVERDALFRQSLLP
jgi:cyclic dehypoxanthinyl futalosine synthase